MGVKSEKGKGLFLVAPVVLKFDECYKGDSLKSPLERGIRGVFDELFTIQNIFCCAHLCFLFLLSLLKPSKNKI